MESDVVYNRAKLWQIGFFALNNTATNTFLLLMMYVSYYASGIAGVAAITIGFLLTAMRIFDGITDPLIGFFIDRTDGKFGKFRPSMVLGYVIMIIAVIVLFQTMHLIPTAMRIPYFILVYGVYIIGYTLQTACTKAAQVCLTNDPSQRPIFSLFDGIYNVILFAGGQFFVSNVLVPKHGGFTQEFFNEFSVVVMVVAGVMTVLAVFGISKKDKKEFFGLGAGTPKVKFSDYLEVIKKNRGIQMLIFAASTDKLSNSTMGNAAVPVMIYGIIAGNYAIAGQMGVFTAIPTLVILFIGIQYARKMGQKKALVVSTWVAIFFAIVLGCLILFGDMRALSFESLNVFTVVYVVIFILLNAVKNIWDEFKRAVGVGCLNISIYIWPCYHQPSESYIRTALGNVLNTLCTRQVNLAAMTCGHATSTTVWDSDTRSKS